MDSDIKKRVEAAVAAGAPKDEAVKRGMALQQKRNAQKSQTTTISPTTQTQTFPKESLVSPSEITTPTAPTKGMDIRKPDFSKPEQPPKKGLFQSIGEAVFKPAIDAGRLVGQAGIDLFDIAKGNPKRSANILTDEQKKAFAPDKSFGEVTVSGLRAGAGAASFAVPVGRSFKAVTAFGAGSGAMRGASEGENLNTGNVVGGAAGGAIGGSLVKGAGATLGGLTKKLPERIMGSVFKEPIKTTRAGIAKGGSLGKEALAKGEVGTTKRIYEGAVKQIDNTEDELQQLLINSKGTVKVSDLRKAVKPLIDDLEDAADTTRAANILNRIAALEVRHGKNIPASAANGIKRRLYKEADAAYGTDKAGEMEGVKALARGIKESLENISGVPKDSISQLNKNLSYYGRIRNSMLDKLTRDERNQLLGLSDIPFGAGVLVPGAAPAAVGGYLTKKALGTTIGKTTLAQGLNKAGQGLDKVPSAVGAGITKTGQIGGAMTGSAGGGSMFPTEPTDQAQYGTDGGEYDNQAEQNIPHTDSFTTDQAESQMRPTTITGFTVEQLLSGLSKASAAGDKNAIKAIQAQLDIEQEYQKSLAEGGGVEAEMTEGERTKYRLANTGLKSVKTLLEIYQKDPSVLTKQLIPGKFVSREFDSALFSTVDTLLRIRTGATAPEEEIRRYMDAYGPKYGDSEEAVTFKLNNLINALTSEGGVPKEEVEAIFNPNQQTSVPSSSPLAFSGGQSASFKRPDSGANNKALSAVPQSAKKSAAKNLPLIEQALREEGIDDPKTLAYALATIEHETAGTFEPIEEYGGRQQARRLGYGGGENYFGRGFIQLTHAENYQKIGQRIGLGNALVKNPQLALRPDISAKILAAFFKDRGVAAAASKGDFIAARGPVNGTDRAREIANRANQYLRTLS